MINVAKCVDTKLRVDFLACLCKGMDLSLAVHVEGALISRQGGLGGRPLYTISRSDFHD